MNPKSITGTARSVFTYYLLSPIDLVYQMKMYISKLHNIHGPLRIKYKTPI